MKTIQMITATILCLAFSMAGMVQAVEPKKSKALVEIQTGESYQWHDGPSIRTAVMSTDLVAEFRSPGSPLSGAVNSAFPHATAAPSKGDTVTIWKVDGGKYKPEDINTAIMTTQKTNPSSSISPVFYSSGQRMALPGGVILEFKSNMSKVDIGKWLKQNRYVVVKTMLKGRLYVIHTPAGLPSLETANNIYKSGVVSRAQPNWWTEFQPM